MKLTNFFKRILRKIENKKDSLLLDFPKGLYTDLISGDKIENIISRVPSDFSKLEKAYYIYIELGKILKENPEYVYCGRNISQKIEKYNEKIDERFYGICKSFSELYASILQDSRIGVSAELVKRHKGSPISHIDTIIRIDGKNYITNLISDLYRIKTSDRVNSFCLDLIRPTNDTARDEDNKRYLERLVAHYGKIDSLSREEVEMLDKKINYSFFIPNVTKPGERGIYTEDTLSLLRKEMRDPQLLKKYVLEGKDIPEEEQLRYKLNYIFENINKIVNHHGDRDYLENIREYIRIAKELLTKDDLDRIRSYAIASKGDLSNIISILKIVPPKGKESSNSLNVYYLWSNKEGKYKEKDPKEIKDYLDGFEKDSLEIIGIFDIYDHRDIDELGLEL